ncbi:amino acid permease [Mycobacterium sp. LTG2003]
MITEVESDPNRPLRRVLQQRHLTMIALGGIIGAGLFVGSGSVIQTAGALAPLAYAIGGLVLLLVMRMLAEMASTRPAVGSFAEYARLALGPGAGFIIGWTYWYFWVVVVAFEAVAGAEIIGAYLPEYPLWIIAATIMAVMTVINMLSVRAFGETEFWFASIKVVTIVAFLLVSIAGLANVLPGQHHEIAPMNAPDGLNGVLAALTVVVFSYFGAEIVTVAAAEAKDPVRAVSQATKTVVWRVIVFYVGSVTLIVLLVPYSDIHAGASPFVTALDLLEIPGAAQVMQFVILTAVLSLLNSGIYTSSRMMFALAERGEAPRALLGVTKRGTPARAILLATAAGWVSVAVAYIAPESVFEFLLNAAGSVALVIYGTIAVSQIRLRRALEHEGGRPTVAMWAFPYLSWFTVALLAATIVGMLAIPSARSQLAVGLIAPAAIACIYVPVRWWRRKTTTRSDLPQPKPDHAGDISR